MLASFLIGLREGLEAALVVGILIAYLTQLRRRDVLPRLWAGIGAAIGLALAIGAFFTFGAYALTFQAQEIIGGLLSLLAVAMVTWMIFWMQANARTLAGGLRSDVDRAIATGGLRGIVVLGFVSVAREGVETTLLLWSMVQSLGNKPEALAGAVLGILCAAVLGWLVARGMLRLNLQLFFTWTGAFLILVAAGVLAYGIGDLQEAGVLPGPFTELAPLHTAGVVAVGWSAFPFGWAFDLTGVFDPVSALAVLLQATIGFTARMSWLQVIAWILYVAVVGAVFLVRAAAARPRPAAASAATADPTLRSSDPRPHSKETHEHPLS